MTVWPEALQAPALRVDFVFQFVIAVVIVHQCLALAAPSNRWGLLQDISCICTVGVTDSVDSVRSSFATVPWTGRKRTQRINTKRVSCRFEAYMRRLSLALMLCIGVVSAPCQTGSSKYQPGTILTVQHHQASSSDTEAAPTQYDVSVRIDETVYVVLYTPSHGSNTVEFSEGLEFLFSVGKETLTLATPGTRDGNTELPILRTTKLPPQPAIDWSKAPSQYYSMKMKNLSTELNLSEEQQAKIKPIAEQESAEAAGVIFTPVVSRKERLSQWQKIVQSSDAKMIPILSEAQRQKLQEIRKDQKRELKELIAKKDSEGRK